MNSELEIVNAAVQFMQRVQLQGNEVPAYVGVMQYLGQRQQQLSAPQPEEPPAAAPPIE